MPTLRTRLGRNRSTGLTAAVSSGDSGGGNDTKYHVTLDSPQPLLDKLGRTVPMNDMVFAARFEITEQELEDGCFLTASVGLTDTVWQADDSSMLSGGRYFIACRRQRSACVSLSLSLDSHTQITVERGYQSSTPGTQATRNEQHPTTRSTFATSGSRTRCRRRTIFISGRSCTPTAGR